MRPRFGHVRGDADRSGVSQIGVWNDVDWRSETTKRSKAGSQLE
jgi:hypothetical protein